MWFGNRFHFSGKRVNQDLVLQSKSLAEEVSRLPRRPPWILCDVVSNQEIDLHELDGGIEVERLVHIVRGRVVTCGGPIIVEFLGVEVDIFGFVPLGDKDRGDALSHKGVLVSANK